MLTKWDEYPIHQIPVPIAQPVSNDPNIYDRYWWAMFSDTADTHIGFGLTMHPNKQLIDAAFSISRGGKQEALFASGFMPVDRTTKVGPITLTVVEPLRKLHLHVDSVEGLSADLYFDAITGPLEEPRFVRTVGTTVTGDVTRLAQFGQATGTIEFRGEQIELEPGKWFCLRDRSWGTRGMPSSAPGAPAPTRSAAFWWFGAVFADECFAAVVQEDSDGTAHVRSAAKLPRFAPGTTVMDEKFQHSDMIAIDVDFIPHTRWAAHAEVRLGPRGLLNEAFDIQPITRFQQKGLGYLHPEWPLGKVFGDERVGRESWDLDEIDPLCLEHVHTQQVCFITRADGTRGVGIFEQGIIGPHVPSRLPDGFGEQLPASL